jgi:hypothetical protein
MSYVPAKIADYFGDAAANVKIVEAYRADTGWTHLSAPASYDALRELSREGYTAVGAVFGHRLADFTIAEVLADTARPVFGGRVI